MNFAASSNPHPLPLSKPVREMQSSAKHQPHPQTLLNGRTPCRSAPHE